MFVPKLVNRTKTEADFIQCLFYIFRDLIEFSASSSEQIFPVKPIFFQELSLTASADHGTIVSMAVYRNGTKVARSFRPDFVLVRQNLRDAGEDNKNILLGFKYGGVPTINNLNAIYNFQVKENNAFLVWKGKKRTVRQNTE